MGYTTEFIGSFKLDKQLKESERKILQTFSETRQGGNIEPFEGRPGLWCDWQPNSDGTAIIWSGAEKFYNYVEWLEYIIKHFIEPWGNKLNGEVEWYGEDRDDVGKIIVKDNKVETIEGGVYYG